MKQFRLLFFMVLVAAAIGCSHTGSPPVAGNVISTSQNKHTSPPAPVLKQATSIRINRYTDARMMGNPRKVGTRAVKVSGLGGKDIVLDQDAAEMVTGSMKQRLSDIGFKVSEEQDDYSLFELSGVVKELTYNVMARDVTAIVVETTVKDINTGKIVWSGIVEEQKERFADVSGNSKDDIADFLRKELDIVTAKIRDAISASLMASHPDLFNLTPSTKPIPGVKVLVAPAANTDAVAISTFTPHANANSGLLLIKTTPARAKVYLDGVYYGLSPLRLEIEAGIHDLRVKLDGYPMLAERVSVRKGDNTEMELTLEH